MRRMTRSSAVGLAAAGLVAGLVVAGLNVASAQTSPTPTPAPSSAPDAKPHHGRGQHGMGKGMLGRGALHGEFTTRAPGGGYQTMAMQHGAVTAVSATSVTVRSEDGFSRTYAVNDDTLVKAGDQGIADVANGDQVSVLAVVSGGSARAVHLVDTTKVGELGEKWRPGRKQPAPSTSAAA
jgi:hypothetical protein